MSLIIYSEFIINSSPTGSNFLAEKKKIIFSN